MNSISSNPERLSLIEGRVVEGSLATPLENHSVATPPLEAPRSALHPIRSPRIRAGRVLLRWRTTVPPRSYERPCATWYYLPTKRATLSILWAPKARHREPKDPMGQEAFKPSSHMSM